MFDKAQTKDENGILRISIKFFITDDTMRVGIAASILVLLQACGGSSGPAPVAPPPPPPPVTNVPTISGGSYATSEIVGFSGGVTANDPDGNPLSFEITSSPMKGTVTEFDTSSGDFTYVPNPQQDGVDTFSIAASNGQARSTPATIDVEILKWSGTQHFGTASDDFVWTGGTMVATGDGLLLGGSTSGSLDGLPRAGNHDTWLRRLDRRGNDVWTRQFGSIDWEVARAIIPAHNGGGWFVIEPVATNSNFFARKANINRFDTDGNLLWRITAIVDAESASQVSRWAAIDQNGDLYILSGADADGKPRHSTALTKHSGIDGAKIWEKIFYPSDIDGKETLFPDTTTVSFHGLDVDSSNNVVIAGTIWTIAPVLRSCEQCGAILSLDTDGNVRWIREVIDVPTTTCGSNTAVTFDTVMISSDNSIYLTGEAEPSNSGERAVHVSKFSPDGTTHQWTHCESSGASISSLRTPVVESRDGGFLSYGHKYLLDITAQGPEEIFVLKHSPDGDLIWASNIPVLDQNGFVLRAFAASVVEDEQGLIYITGHSISNNESHSYIGGWDIFLMRLDENGGVR